MKKKIRTIVCLVVIFSYNILFCQTHPDFENGSYMPNITPPSPPSYNLGNYGNVPAGEFSGSTNISIPLIDFSTKLLTIPLSLFYTSNGLKVDDISGNVGLGWNFASGGVITRIVRDLPDDKNRWIVPPELSGSYTSSSIVNSFFDNAQDSTIDTERDLYSFNFLGHSGKFVYDYSNNPVLYSQEDLLIEKWSEAGTVKGGFVFTTKDGNKYYFTESESTSLRSVGDGFFPPGQKSETAWYLSKIVSVSAKTIFFEYEAQGGTYYQSKSQTLTVMRPYPQEKCGSSNLWGIDPFISTAISHQIQVSGKKLVRIYTDNMDDGEIKIIYTAETDTEGYKKVSNISKYAIGNRLLESLDFSYYKTSSNRIFLQEITFSNGKKYNFDYVNPSAFPLRLDNGQDHWGYYNGKNNPNIIPRILTGYDLENLVLDRADKEPDADFAQIGMISKITYPTGGSTSIIYEGNSYWDFKEIIPPKKTAGLLVVKNNTHGNTVSDSFTFTPKYNHLVNIWGRSISNTDCHNVYDPLAFINVLKGNEKVTLLKYIEVSQSYEECSSGDLYFDPDIRNFYFEAKEGETYTVILSADRPCTRSSCAVIYSDENITQQYLEQPLGGIRVKSTNDSEKLGSTDNYKRYFYSGSEKGITPIYYDMQTERTYCDNNNWLHCKYVDNTFLKVSSSSLVSLFNNDYNCYYPSVSISYGGDNYENGGESKTFYVDKDYFGNSLLGESILSAPWTNFGWKHGVESSHQIFDKDHNRLRYQEDKYTENNFRSKQISSYALRRNFEIKCNFQTQHKCTLYETQNYTSNPCYGKNVDESVQLKDLRNLDIVEYKSISRFTHLESRKTTDYVGGQELETRTEYFYNNPSHYQLTSQKITFPDQSFQTTDYSYAHEKNKTLLIQKNMVGIPLEKQTKKNGKTISITETIYPDILPDTQTGNLLLPKSVSSLDLLTGNLSPEVIYDQYDDKGNLQQYTSKTGISTAIIWGYNSTQPIAKIEGAKYSQVSPYITNIVGQSNADSTSGTPASEQDVVDALDLFRQKSELSGFQITTYSYDPLIGVKSITPPNGVRQVYIYDTANRLTEVREQSQTGNLLKEYQYKYKN